MQAFRKPFPLATQTRAAFDASELERQSPQHSATATSGTYFKAVRATPAETAALARGEPVLDSAKIEGLRFELEVGVWRGDTERIAQRLIDDGGHFADPDDE